MPTPLPPAAHFADDLRYQSSLLAGRAPAYHRLLPLLVDRADDPRFAAAWAGRSFHAVFDRPLLTLAALRDEALADPAHPLRAALADDADPDAVTSAGLDAALDRPRLWTLLRDRFVQTNETTRCVAWRLVAPEAPFTLVDLGCSAGLNLVGDALPWCWTGLSPRTHAAPHTRLGFDRNPLDVRDEANRRWLRACLWPGELERLRRFDAAVTAFLAAAPTLVAADLASVPAQLAALPGPVVAYQTLVRDYLPPEVCAAYEAGMRAWVGPGRTWVELEYVPGGAPCGILRHDEGGDTLIATCGYHPTELTPA